jgi:hypothetical protein
MHSPEPMHVIASSRCSPRRACVLLPRAGAHIFIIEEPHA